MRKVFKVPGIIAASVVVLVLLVVGGLLGARAYLQHRNAQRFAIRTPAGVDESMYVHIGGIEQWVSIRGDDRRNPVILCLNGGPGASWVPLTQIFLPWERYFTVVQWDQRGEGKTLESTGLSIASTMTIARMTRDGIEVAEFLRSHLHKKKIILLAHSWGSILGIHMVKERPDLFSAYVGTGQVGDLERSFRLTYFNTISEAKAAGDTRATAQLQQIGPPPYDYAHIQNYLVLTQWLNVYASPSDRDAIPVTTHMVLTEPNYSLRDMQYRMLGFVAVPTPQFYEAMFSTNLVRLGPAFKVPIYFFQGAEDNITLPSVAHAYFDTIRAPRKAFVLFPGGGHFTIWMMPDAFLQKLRATMRGPLGERRVNKTMAP
jgi:pimeloyl-ACP methyl ester carboxylesterase